LPSRDEQRAIGNFSNVNLVFTNPKSCWWDEGAVFGRKWFGIVDGWFYAGTLTVGLCLELEVKRVVPGVVGRAEWNRNLDRSIYFGILSGFRNPQ